MGSWHLTLVFSATTPSRTLCHGDVFLLLSRVAKNQHNARDAQRREYRKALQNKKTLPFSPTPKCWRGGAVRQLQEPLL